MPINLIDIGVNLTNPAFKNSVSQLLEDAASVGVKRLIVTGTSVQESRAANVLCQVHPKQLWSTAGVHPHDASTWSATSLQALKELAQHNATVAIGECGLDFNRNYSTPDEQKIAFEQQLQLAVDTQMPIFLHERDAFVDMQAMLREYRPELRGAVVHCFTGNPDQAAAYLELNCHLGVTGWVCDERRGQDLQAAVKIIPDNRIMLETDAPYLLPRTLRPKPKSRHNTPVYLPEVLKVTAELRQQSAQELADVATANTERFFELAKLSEH